MRFYFDVDDKELEVVNELCKQMYNNSIDVFRFRDEICKQVEGIMQSKQNEIRTQIIKQAAAKPRRLQLLEDLKGEV